MYRMGKEGLQYNKEWTGFNNKSGNQLLVVGGEIDQVARGGGAVGGEGKGCCSTAAVLHIRDISQYILKT